MAPPEISVVVPSHFRPLRLRWLLNALHEQTLDRSRWEVIVGHDSGDDTERLLREHPLATAGILRSATQPTGTGVPASNRNRALAFARAETVVFTDDDCRPPAGWLESVLHAANRHPGAILQGPVAPDPAEWSMLRATFPSSQQFDDVPRIWGESCNIVYPKRVLDELGGFHEAGWLTCEDTDLLLRALRLGLPYLGEQSMLTFHCVEEGTLLAAVRAARRWRDLPALLCRHPEMRRHLFLRVFWKEAHAWLLLGIAGLGLARSHRPACLLVLPWALARPVRGGGWRGALRHLLELPGWAAIDAAEMIVLARASARAGVAVL
jgi:GT2 family glycosyltransferase